MILICYPGRDILVQYVGEGCCSRVVSKLAGSFLFQHRFDNLSDLERTEQEEVKIGGSERSRHFE
jgi:hypothetical protein